MTIWPLTAFSFMKLSNPPLMPLIGCAGLQLLILFIELSRHNGMATWERKEDRRAPVPSSHQSGLPAIPLAPIHEAGSLLACRGAKRARLACQPSPGVLQPGATVSPGLEQWLLLRFRKALQRPFNCPQSAFSSSQRRFPWTFCTHQSVQKLPLAG